jgi:hypothetical protein
MNPYTMRRDPSAKPGEVRILAEWVESEGPQTGPDFDPDLVEYGYQFCETLEEAARVSAEHDFNGESRAHEVVYDRYCGWMFHRDLDPYSV